MIALVAAAFADPSAVRTPGAPVTAVEVGTPSASVAHWWDDRGVAAWTRLDGGATGAVLALRHEPERWGLAAHAATGVLVTVPQPGLGLHASLAAGPALRTDRGGHRLQVVVPVSAALGQVRVPILLEGASMFAWGRWAVGGRGALGTVLTETRPALTLQAGLVVSRRSTEPADR